MADAELASITAGLSSPKAGQTLGIDNIDDLRIRAIRPLVPSCCLLDEDAMAGDQSTYDQIKRSRQQISRALRGDDGRLVVVAGPVSAHDPVAVMEYARRLQAVSERLGGELIVVMRVFLDEPSGGAGYWSGAMYDPDLDGSFQINKGFRLARKLLLDVNRLGLPVGCLYLDPISPQFVADLVSWSCIASRTSSSFLHRELASGLSTPVGFQAAASGPAAAELAVDAVRMTVTPHAFFSVSKQGVAGIVETTGNRDCHVVLPAAGGVDAVARACAKLDALELPPRAMVECTSRAEAEQVASAVAAGGKQVLGVLLPSFLHAGAQELKPGDAARKYGVSVTEPCMDWAATEAALEALAAAVTARRAQSAPTPPREASHHNLTAFFEHGGLSATDNLRVRRIRPLIPAAICIEELPADAAVKQLVFQTRCDISGLMQVTDRRRTARARAHAERLSRSARDAASTLPAPPRTRSPPRVLHPRTRSPPRVLHPRTR